MAKAEEMLLDILVNSQSADSAIDVLQQEARAFRYFRGGDGKSMIWLDRTVDVLYILSTIIFMLVPTRLSNSSNAVSKGDLIDVRGVGKDRRQL